MEIRYSTPTKFAKEMTKINDKMNSTKAEGWPIRRDDSFPYSQGEHIYMNGYYSSRPHLKKNIRLFGEAFHSSLRLVTQQMIRKDLPETRR